MESSYIYHIDFKIGKVMHDSLIDSNDRPSLSGNEPDVLTSSDSEKTNKSSDVNQSIASLESSSVRLKTAITHPDDVMKTDEKVAQVSSTKSTGVFHWTYSHKREMSTFGVIVLFAFVTGIEYGVILPTVYSYVRKMTDINIYVGLVLSSYSVSGSIAGLIMGKISDVTGKVKILLLISITFEIGGNVLYFVANHIYVVILGRLTAGIGMGFGPPVSYFICRINLLLNRFTR